MPFTEQEKRDIIIGVAREIQEKRPGEITNSEILERFRQNGVFGKGRDEEGFFANIGEVLAEFPNALGEVTKDVAQEVAGAGLNITRRTGEFLTDVGVEGQRRADIIDPDDPIPQIIHGASELGGRALTSTSKRLEEKFGIPARKAEIAELEFIPDIEELFDIENVKKFPERLAEQLTTGVRSQKSIFTPRTLDALGETAEKFRANLIDAAGSLVAILAGGLKGGLRGIGTTSFVINTGAELENLEQQGFKGEELSKRAIASGSAQTLLDTISGTKLFDAITRTGTSSFKNFVVNGLLEGETEVLQDWISAAGALEAVPEETVRQELVKLYESTDKKQALETFLTSATLAGTVASGGPVADVRERFPGGFKDVREGRKFDAGEPPGPSNIKTPDEPTSDDLQSKINEILERGRQKKQVTTPEEQQEQAVRDEKLKETEENPPTNTITAHERLEQQPESREIQNQVAQETRLERKTLPALRKEARKLGIPNPNSLGKSNLVQSILDAVLPQPVLATIDPRVPGIPVSQVEFPNIVRSVQGNKGSLSGGNRSIPQEVRGRPSPGPTVQPPRPGPRGSIRRTEIPELSKPLPGSPEIESLIGLTDQIRQQNTLGIDTRTQQEIIERAKQNVENDFFGTKRRVLDSFRKDGALNPDEVVELEQIFNTQGLAAFLVQDPKARIAAFKDAINLGLVHRAGGNVTSRSLSIRGKGRTFSDKFKLHLFRTLYSPNIDTTNKTQEQIEAEIAKHAEIIENVHKQLLSSGLSMEQIIDLDPSKVDDFRTMAAISREISTGMAKPEDKLFEWYYFSLLSLLTTQGANLIGNTLFNVYRLSIERAMHAAVSQTAIGLGKKARITDPTFGEIPVILSSLLSNFTRSARIAALTWQTEIPVFDFGQTGDINPRFELAGLKAGIKGSKGRFIRWPTRLLNAADQMAKALLFSAHMAAMSFRQAKLEGHKGVDFSNRMAFLLNNPTNQFTIDATLEAVQEADQGTFQQELVGMVEVLSRARSASNSPVLRPVLKLLIPFLRTAYNIIAREGLGRAPVIGPLVSKLTKRRGTGTQFAAEQLLSLGALGIVLEMINMEDDEGRPLITGSAIFEQGKTTLNKFLRNQIPPQSILVNGQYWEYSRIEPFGAWLGFVVDQLQSIQEFRSEREVAKSFQRAWNRTLGFFENKLFLKSISDLVMLMHGQRDFSQWFSGFFSAFSPNMVRGTLREYDELVRDYKNNETKPLGYLRTMGIRLGQRAFPVDTIQPLPIVDHWGRPIRREGPFNNPGSDFLYRITSPVRVQNAKTPVNIDRMYLNYNNMNPNDERAPPYNFLASLQEQLNKTPRAKHQGEGPKITEEQWHEYMRRKGQLAAQMITTVNFDYENPTEQDMNDLQQLWRTADRIVKAQMWPGFFGVRGRRRRRRR